VPYYVATGQVGWIDAHLFEEELVLLGEDGAPFFDRSRPVAYLICGKAWVNNHAHVLRARPGLTNRFLLHWLNTVDYTRFVSGTTRAKLPQGPMRQIPVPVPPLAEQQRIVEAVDLHFTRLDDAVATLERTREKLQSARASVLKAAVEGRLAAPDGWTWARLGDLLTTIEAGNSFRCDPRVPEEDEVGVIKVSAVTWGEYDESESKTCMDPGRVDERLFVRPGDFLFSRANTIDLVGACVIARNVHKRVMLSDKILRLRFAEPMERWCLVVLRSPWGRREIQRLATGNQESMRNIGQDRIRQIRVPVPPLAEQQRIVAEVERRLSVLDEVERQVEVNLARCGRLRQAILKRAFEGRLVPQPKDVQMELGL
jgi:type I restriction enzyme S subunit